MNSTRTIKSMLIAATLIALALPAAAQTATQLSYTWTAPTTGSAVDHYVVQHRINGGDWVQVATTSTNSYTLTATYDQAHEIRVAGVDAEDRQGPFSVASDPITPDPGAPGAPGKPTPF